MDNVAFSTPGISVFVLGLNWNEANGGNKEPQTSYGPAETS